MSLAAEASSPLTMDAIIQKSIAACPSIAQENHSVVKSQTLLSVRSKVMLAKLLLWLHKQFVTAIQT